MYDKIFDKPWKRAIWISAAVLIIGALAIWGSKQTTARKQAEMSLHNVYLRNSLELVHNVSNIEVNMGKLLLADSPTVDIRMLNEISRLADAAVSNLSQLPEVQDATSKIMGFLNLTGDYCRSLVERTGNQLPLSYDDSQQLAQLHDASVTLLNLLQSTGDTGKSLDANAIESQWQWDETTFQQKFSEFAQSNLEYPTLIYDGPFSQNVLDRQPKGLPEGLINEDQAKQVAKDTLKMDANATYDVAGVGGAVMETYNVNITTPNGTGAYVQVSRKGGKAILFIDDTPAGEETVPPEQCEQAAKQYLQQNGYGDMSVTWSQKYNGMMVYNFAPMQDGAVIYSDLVKVKVRMDNAQVAALDATAYWLNHVQRTVEQPAVTEEESKAMLNPDFQVKKSALSIIPLPGGNETLAWEFMGVYQDENYVIYVDAKTGNEIQVFKIVDMDGNSLTV